MALHATNDLFQSFARGYEARRDTEMTLSDYLEACRDEPLMYASAAERILDAIGKPEFVDTAKDSRLGRIFMNRTIRTYPAFAEFYGMEETIERIVSFFRHAAQGLEERKQILYLLGPVGGGKSSLAERQKALMEVHPIYVLKAGNEISPVFESPLGLFDPETMGSEIEKRYGVPRRRLGFDMAALAVAVRHRRDLRVRIGLGHPQRQRTPAAAHLQNRLTILQIGMGAGLRQRRLFRLIQRLAARGIEAAGVFQPLAQAQLEELGRQFVMLLVRRVRMFGDGALGHFARKGRLVVRPVAIQSLSGLRHQAVDRRACHEVRERRVLKLANGDIGQVHRRPRSSGLAAG